MKWYTCCSLYTHSENLENLRRMGGKKTARAILITQKLRHAKIWNEGFFNVLNLFFFFTDNSHLWNQLGVNVLLIDIHFFVYIFFPKGMQAHLSNQQSQVLLFAKERSGNTQRSTMTFVAYKISITLDMCLVTRGRNDHLIQCKFTIQYYSTHHHIYKLLIDLLPKEWLHLTWLCNMKNKIKRNIWPHVLLPEGICKEI